MAIGRLLSPKLNPHFNSRGFFPLTRRLFSSSLEDGRKFDRLSESEASTNKDIDQKGMHWYSLGGLLTNLKEKIVGNIFLMDKTSSEDSVLPKPLRVSSSDVTASTKVASLLNVAENKKCISSCVKEESSVSEVGSHQDASQSVSAENKNCIASSMNEESSVSGMGTQDDAFKSVSAENKNCITSGMNEESLVSEMGTQDVSKSVARIETSGKRESISVNEEKLEGLELAQEKVLRCKQAERVDTLEKPNSKYISLAFLNEEASEILASSGENQGKLKPEKRQSNQAMKTLSNLFINSDLYKEVKLHQRFESLSNTNSSITTGESHSDQHGLFGKMLSDPVQKIKSNSKENDKHRLSDAPQNPDSLTSILLRGGSHGQKSGDLASIRERKSTFSFETPSKTVVPVEMSRELSMKKVIDSLYLQTDNGTNADANSLTKKSDLSCAVEEEESKGETLVKKALKKATSPEDMVEKICIPALIGDPDVPIALVKEPTRTVKIHPLTHDLSSNQIKEALMFCKSNISKFIMGSSRTYAFVEFETEDGKERALAEHSISILNTQLFISRIDIPRTTVARISNLSNSEMRNVRTLCKPYGQIREVFNRGGGVADVRFDVSEWPNMLTILNSLNGMEIDGKKLVVGPATTVIPPEILRVLWKDPKEKRYVKSVIKNLVREIEQPLDASRCYRVITDLLQ